MRFFLKTKKITIEICLFICIICVVCTLSFSLYDFHIGTTITNIINNVCYSLLGSATITMLLTIKEYMSDISHSIDKIGLLFLNFDNEVGGVRYYVDKPTLDKIANSISVCVRYTIEINDLIGNIYDGLFCFQNKKKKEFYNLGYIIEQNYSKKFYSLGQILQDEKEYSKKHISDIYNAFVKTIYESEVPKQINELLGKYKSRYKLIWLSEDVLVQSEKKRIKDEFFKKYE